MTMLERMRRKIAASNEGRKLCDLSAKEKTREKRLRRLLAKLEAGKDVMLRDLETALTKDEWISYKSMVDDERSLKNLDIRPSEFDRYIELLKKADFFDNRASSTKKTNRSKIDDRGRSGSLRLYHKSESLYEDALTLLDEILSSADSQTRIELLSWIDRDVDFSAGSTIGADKVTIPRIKG